MIVLDVETTGVDRQKCAMVSIGAVDFENPSRLFYAEVRVPEVWEPVPKPEPIPGIVQKYKSPHLYSGPVEITKEAMKINGFTIKQIRSPQLPLLQDVLEHFIEWVQPIKDRTIAGENPMFDIEFMMNAMTRCGLRFHTGYRSVDLHSTSYVIRRGLGQRIPLRGDRSDINSNDTITWCGLSPEPRPHNALTGAKMEAECFHRILFGQGLFPEFLKRPFKHGSLWRAG